MIQGDHALPPTPLTDTTDQTWGATEDMACASPVALLAEDGEHTTSPTMSFCP